MSLESHGQEHSNNTNIVVNEATQGFDADFGKIIERTKAAVKRTLGRDQKDYRQKQFANLNQILQNGDMHA